MIKGACHCGAVTFEFNDTPEWGLACNCSVCRRYGAIWIYSSAENIRFEYGPDALDSYSWGDRNIAFYHCKTCGCTTHWEGLKTDSDKMAVNLLMSAPEVIESLPVRRFDGADSWSFLD